MVYPRLGYVKVRYVILSLQSMRVFNVGKRGFTDVLLGVC